MKLHQPSGLSLTMMPLLQEVLSSCLMELLVPLLRQPPMTELPTFGLVQHDHFPWRLQSDPYYGWK